MRATRIGERALSILRKWLTLKYLLDLFFFKLPDLPLGGRLVARGVTFLDMPLVASETVKGVQVRQRTKPRSSAKQLHRPRADVAMRSFGRELVGVAHDTISSRNRWDVVREHYRGVARSLILGMLRCAGLAEIC